MTEIPSLSRPDFFDGQSLTAADLQAVQTYHRELLWLHQRTLHGSGIASGFGVTGAKGDKQVVVAPGYAVDTKGQSIVLTAPRTMPIPAVVSGPTGAAAVYYLTVAYAADNDLDPVVRQGTCGSNGAVRRTDAPLLAWRAPADASDSLVLCSISVLNCKLTGPVDVSLRRSALPAKQPFVFAGQTRPAATDWALWHLGDTAAGALVGLTATVSTAEAGFANTPRYHAAVVGNRGIQQQHADAPSAVLDGHVQIDSPSANEFTVRMTLPPGNTVNPAWALAPDKLIALVTSNGWYVSWVGVEG